jgi:hypothetical protein
MRFQIGERFDFQTSQKALRAQTAYLNSWINVSLRHALDWISTLAPAFTSEQAFCSKVFALAR